jgi:hypothetical protein
MIHEILIVIFFTYIWVLGVKIATSEGMILERLGNWGEEQEEEGHKIFKGLITCQWCLPGFHSVVGWAYAFILGGIPFEFNWKYLVMWPIIIMGTSLCTGLTWTIYLTINQIREKNEIEAMYFQHAEEMIHFDLKERKERHNSEKKKNNGK